MNTRKTTSTLNETTLYNAYHDMVLLRRFEEKAGQLYGMGSIGGFCHLYIGQEAVAIGIKNAMEKNDSVITSYRAHGLILALNGDPRSIMAELMGKETGCSKGKGGSMHMFNKKEGFYGGHGIVAAQVPLGTGIGFAIKYKGENGVSITLLGDGAVNQGQVYESFNMAKLWNLPVIYIIENNEYAMGTSVERSCSNTKLYKRGEAFNIPGKEVDGMDFFAVYDAMHNACDYVRQGNGPILLEMKTYRYRGHSMSDPARYRSREEVEEYRQHRDPINSMKQHLLKNKKITEKKLKEVETNVKEIINKAVKFAQESSEPQEGILYDDVLLNKKSGV